MATARAPDSAPAGTHRAPRRNLGGADRAVSVAIGATLGVAATQARGTLGVLLGLAGGALVARGITGSDQTTRLLGQEPDEREYAAKQGWSSAAKAPRAVTVNASRETVWSVVREVERWPNFMVNIASASSDGNRLNFVSETPRGPLATTATITEDVPNEVFAWESDKNATVPNAGKIELKDAPGGRGTEIHAKIAYQPPGGSLGRYAAKLTQQEPGIQTRRDLKRLKSLIEAGEVATNARNPAEAIANAPKA